MTGKIWVLAADTTRARILSTATPRGELVEQHELLHPASRRKPADLLSDRPGRDSNSDRRGSHTVGHEKDVKAHEAQQFAKEISKKLNEFRQRDAFNRIYLVACPQMLGHLRKELSEAVRTRIRQESDVNLVKEDLAVIRAHLPTHL
ncbi:MAG: host attachment protein [Pseudomonadales bacterium]|jgi:protein required for attachment to host cells